MSVEREHSAGTSVPAADRGTAIEDAAAAIKAHQPAGRDVVVVVDLPVGAAAPETTAARSNGASPRDVHVAANLYALVAASPLAISEKDLLAKEQRDLNEVVHRVLIVGLAISTALMLAGVALALFEQRDLPTTVPDIHDVFNRVAALRPSGFVALGLLVLIATPILRVVGSIGAFLYEHDWRFAAITSLVLGVLAVSLLLGRG